MDVCKVRDEAKRIRKLSYTSDYLMSLDVGISSYPLWKFLKGQKVSNSTILKIERFVNMWIKENKTWFDEREFNQLQNDYYSMVDRYTDIKEKYELAQSQNKSLIEQNKQLQAELLQAKSLLAISETTNKIITAVNNKEDVLR